MRQQQVDGEGEVELGPIHQLIQILTKAWELSAGQPERREFLISGVARVVIAAVGITVLDIGLAPGGGGAVPGRPPARLSPRQRQVLALVLSGLCDKEIAERLGISRYTVNQYTKAIYRHYSVSSRAQLMARVLVQAQAIGAEHP